MAKTFFRTAICFFTAFAAAATVCVAQAQPDPAVLTTPKAIEVGVQVVPRSSTGVVISGLTLICKGSETMLKVEGDYESFEWNTGSKDRIIRVNKEGIYEVTVKTKGGCSLTSAVNVQVRICT
jgi:hypothetical protein